MMMIRRSWVFSMIASKLVRKIRNMTFSRNTHDDCDDETGRSGVNFVTAPVSTS